MIETNLLLSAVNSSVFYGLDDGTSLTYAAGPEFSPKFATDYEAAHADYLATKEQLLQIIDSYRSFAQPEGHLITEDPIFVGGDVWLEGWLPDGRYLAYFEYTQEQVDASLGPPVRLMEALSSTTPPAAKNALITSSMPITLTKGLGWACATSGCRTAVIC